MAPGLIDTHVHVTCHFSHDRFIDNRLVGQDEPVPDSVLFEPCSDREIRCLEEATDASS